MSVMSVVVGMSVLIVSSWTALEVSLGGDGAGCNQES